VAELVDALVSNTNGVTPVPVRLRPKVLSRISSLLEESPAFSFNLVMHFVYVIISLKTGRFYVGESSDVERRLAIHNDRLLNKNSTISGIPWELYLTIECKNRSQALKIEQHIKQMKSRTYIQNLLKYPEMREKLLEKYSDLS
jgi:putative endonuclease